MNLSRRFFLGGALALAGAAIVPAHAAIPRIVGDGVHDDADGLNALIAGDEVSIESELLALARDGVIWFNEGGRFLIGKPIRIARSHLYLNGGTFIAAPTMRGAPFVFEAGAQINTITNLTIDVSGSNAGVIGYEAPPLVLRPNEFWIKS